MSIQHRTSSIQYRPCICNPQPTRLLTALHPLIRRRRAFFFSGPVSGGRTGATGEKTGWLVRVGRDASCLACHMAPFAVPLPSDPILAWPGLAWLGLLASLICLDWRTQLNSALNSGPHVTRTSPARPPSCPHRPVASHRLLYSRFTILQQSIVRILLFALHTLFARAVVAVVVAAVFVVVIVAAIT